MNSLNTAQYLWRILIYQIPRMQAPQELNARLKKEFRELSSMYGKYFRFQNLKWTITIPTSYTTMYATLELHKDFPRYAPTISLKFFDRNQRPANQQVKVYNWLPSASLAMLMEQMREKLENQSYPKAVWVDAKPTTASQTSITRPQVKEPEMRILEETRTHEPDYSSAYHNGSSYTESSSKRAINADITEQKFIKLGSGAQGAQVNQVTQQATQGHQPIVPELKHYNKSSSIKEPQKATISLVSGSLKLQIQRQPLCSFKVSSSSQQSYNGIRNFGNTCFLNSAIQMLFCRKLLRYLVVSSNSTPNPRWNALSDIFLDLETSIDAYSHAPTIERLEANFRGYYKEQRDSYEFVLHLLTGLAEEKEAIRDLFELFYKEKIQCRCVGRQYGTDVKRDSFVLEVFANQKNPSVKDCLEKGSEMVGDYCNFCRSNKYVKSQYDKSPAYVFVHINWGEFDRVTTAHGSRGGTGASRGCNNDPYGYSYSNGSSYSYGNSYSTSSYSTSSYSNSYQQKSGFNYFSDFNLGGANYSLQGVICHSGTQEGGHYVYYNKQNSKWICFNDSSVSIAGMPEHRRVILAVYERKTPVTEISFGLKESEQEKVRDRLATLQARKKKRYDSSFLRPAEKSVNQTKVDYETRQNNLINGTGRGTTGNTNAGNQFRNHSTVPTNYRRY